MAALELINYLVVKIEQAINHQKAFEEGINKKQSLEEKITIQLDERIANSPMVEELQAYAKSLDIFVAKERSHEQRRYHSESFRNQSSNHNEMAHFAVIPLLIASDSSKKK
eukprot:309312_1